MKCTPLLTLSAIQKRKLSLSVKQLVPFPNSQRILSEDLVAISTLFCDADVRLFAFLRADCEREGVCY
jgi:hypothetical protein